MLQKLLRALKGTTGQDWLEYAILAGGTLMVGLAATATLGHRLNKQFAAVRAEADSGNSGGMQNGKLDAGTVTNSEPPAVDGLKRGDEEDGPGDAD